MTLYGSNITARGNAPGRSIERLESMQLFPVLTILTALLLPAENRQARLLETRKLERGSASQGLALTKDFYFSSTSQSICRFDTAWNLLEEKSISIEGVNHVGAIDFHEGFI